VLRPKEVEVLRYLRRHAGRPVPIDELLIEVWGYSARSRSRTVYTTIYRLRDALGHPPELRVLPNSGYQLDLPMTAPVGHIPSDPDEFFGREAELASLSSAEARLVTLTGPGGVGKSRLARHWARQQSERYEGGVWVIELDGRSSELELGVAVCRALGREVGSHALTSAQQALQELPPALLVLDGAESAADAIASWIGRVPESHRLLVTSQEPLRLRGERLIRVSGLAASPGEALFLERARTAGCTVPPDAAAVAEIVKKIEGHPLALEIAAAHTPMLPLDAINRALEQGLLRNSERSRPERHHALDSALSWVTSQLGTATRTVLVRLSLFVEGVTLGTAALLLQDLGPPEPMLAELVDLGLVQARIRERELRYTVWPVARAQIPLPEQAQARQHRLHLIRELGARIGPQFGWDHLRFGLSDVLGALQDALDSGSDDDALVLAEITHDLCADVGPHEYIRTLDPQIAPLLARLPAQRTVSLETGLIWMLLRLGGDAQALHARLRGLLEKDLGPMRPIVLAEEAMLVSYRDLPAAEVLAEEALRQGQNSEHLRVVLAVQRARASIANRMRDFDTARHWYSHLANAPHLTARTRSMSLANLIVVELNDCQPERAEALFGPLEADLGRPIHGLHPTLAWNRAYLAFLRERPEEAYRAALQAEQAWQARGSVRVHTARSMRIRAAANLGRWDEVLEGIGRLDPVRGLDIRAGLAFHQRGPGIWPELAQQCRTRAPTYHVYLWRLAAACAAACGELDAARTLLDEALARPELRWERALYTLDQIELHLASGDLQAADQALALLRECDLRPPFVGRARATAASVGAWFGRPPLGLLEGQSPSARAWLELHFARTQVLRGERAPAPTLTQYEEVERMLVELGWRTLSRWVRATGPAARGDG
jgi:tetratricopeptide (TPR) repeat protein